MKTFENFNELAAEKRARFVEFIDDIDEKLNEKGAVLYMTKRCIWATEGHETVWEISSEEFNDMSNEEVLFCIQEDLENLLERYT